MLENCGLDSEINSESPNLQSITSISVNFRFKMQLIARNCKLRIYFGVCF
ncbi:MAG: hypothetical protein EOO48_06525 [Flavobacterium sp.]|nr:MAG: hypothetical protein EOO48_06525 [Flavobacterium sp.]